jgi:hypothetical protein
MKSARAMFSLNVVVPSSIQEKRRSSVPTSIGTHMCASSCATTLYRSASLAWL